MTITELSPLVRRITAGNSSVFTGPGTNTYLVGKEEITVIDPGPAMHCRTWINNRDFFFTYKISIRSRTGKDAGITCCNSSD